MSELLPVTPGRPAIIERNGWRVYVSIHDAEYLLQRRYWRRRIADAHPDRDVYMRGKRGPRRSSTRRFREAQGAMKRWYQRERKYYWDLGLMPPDWKGSLMVPPGYSVSKAGAVTRCLVARKQFLGAGV